MTKEPKKRRIISQWSKEISQRSMVISAEISGSLSYRPFKDENGYTKYEASIIARYVKKIEVGKEEDPTEDEISQVVEVARS